MNRVNTSAGMAVFFGLCVSLGLYIALVLFVFPHVSDDMLILLAPTDRYAVLGGFVAGWLYRKSDRFSARNGFLIGAMSGLAIDGFLLTAFLVLFPGSHLTHHDLVIQFQKWIISALVVVLAGGVAGIVGSALRRASPSYDTASAQIEPKPSGVMGIGRTLVVIGLTFVTIWSVIWYSARPIVPNNLCGIRLGMTPGQVIALKGDRARNTATDTLQFPLEHNVMDVTCSVSFRDGRVVQIVAATDSKLGLLRLLGRVPMSNGRQGIEQYLGTPTHFYTSGDGSRKMLVYENFHAFFVLSLGGEVPQYPRDVVETVAIYDPKKMTPGFSQ